METESFGSIERHTRGLTNVVLPPLMLDARQEPSKYGSTGSADAVVAINLCHIAPFEATLGLLAGCGRVLRPGGRLCLFGPFLLDGQATPSSARYDRELRERRSFWGLRDLGDIEAAAAEHALVRCALDRMPSDNYFLVLEKRAMEASDARGGA